VARTRQSPNRRYSRAGALLAFVTLVAPACSATPSWIPVESAETSAAQPAEAVVDKQVSAAEMPRSSGTEGPPAVRAFAADAEEDVSPTDGCCEASANRWIHSAALNLISSQSDTEMTQVALANVAEWLERSTLFTEEDFASRVEMFAAFTELQEMVVADFNSDWMTFQASTVYANDANAQIYEAARAELVRFISNRCGSLSMVSLRSDAEARAGELTAEFGADPSTIVGSDSLPDHSIFTHSSGRLIASFPSAWSWEEGRSNAIVDLIASPDIESFLSAEAIDGVRLQLVEAATVDDFRALIEGTMIGSSCTRTDELSDSGVRLNITQAFACSDHGASIVGQYNESRGLGLIIEASFDRPDASRADLIRLASIANSALWS
jgi:hypothetical protein